MPRIIKNDTDSYIMKNGVTYGDGLNGYVIKDGMYYGYYITQGQTRVLWKTQEARAIPYDGSYMQVSLADSLDNYSLLRLEMMYGVVIMSRERFNDTSADNPIVCTDEDYSDISVYMYRVSSTSIAVARSEGYPSSLVSVELRGIE